MPSDDLSSESSSSRSIFLATGFAAIVGLSACVARPDVWTKVADGVHLEQYKTYTFHPGKTYLFESEKVSEQADVDRAFEADVREELNRRGLKPVETNPDLIFSYSADKRLEHAGEREWPYYEGAADLVATDAAGRTVWSAHLQALVDPKDNTHRQLKEAIVRAFKHYPSVN
jgi:hypothetical protein